MLILSFFFFFFSFQDLIYLEMLDARMHKRD